MKPINKFFAVLYRVLGPVVRLLFPAKVEGLENVPPSGVLFCPNHTSDVDPLVIAAVLPVNSCLHFMGKAELFQNKALNWFFRKLGGFPVNRGGSDIQAVKTAMQVIKDGHNLMIFPEGTVINSEGIGHVDGLPAHAKAGVAMIGVRTGAIFVPVFVSQGKKLFHKTRVVFGKPYTPTYSGRRGTSEEMQQIADEVLRQAYALGGQAVGGKPL